MTPTLTSDVEELEMRIAEFERTLGEMSNEQVIECLEKSARVATENILYAAACLRTLNARGVDTSKVRLLFPIFVRRLANSQAILSLFERFGDHSAVLNKVSALPIAEQKRIADGGKVELVIPVAGNRFDVVQRDPLELTNEQLNQVFSGPKVLSRPEQESHLRRIRTSSSVAYAKIEVKIEQEQLNALVRHAKKAGFATPSEYIHEMLVKARVLE